MIGGTGTVPNPGPDRSFSLTPEPGDARVAGGSFPWIAATLLGAAGFVINLAPIQLSPGTHMVFGGIAALLSAVVFGPWPGLLAAVIAAARTIWIWGHPYGWLIFSLEAFAVGVLVRRRALRPILADLLFWAVVGAPLLYFVCTFALGMSGIEFGVLTMKQTVNGVFDVVLVELLLLLPFVRRALRVPGAPRLQSAIAVIVTTAAILPALIFGIWVGRREWVDSFDRAQQRSVVYSQAYASQLGQFIALHQEALRGAALSARRGGVMDSTALWRALALTRERFPAFRAVRALDSEGKTIAMASAPEVGAGEVGTSPAMEAYVHRLRGRGGGIVTGVAAGEGGDAGPMVLIGFPVSPGDTLGGYLVGALDVSALPAPMPLPEAFGRLQVADGEGWLVYGSGPRAGSAAPIPARIDSVAFTAVTSAGTQGIAVVSPPGAQAIARQPSGVLAGVARIPGLGWWVWTEMPFERMVGFIAESYIRLFGLLISVMLLALLVSSALARYASKPLLRLGSAAGALASGDLSARVGRLPAAMPKEVRELGTEFDRMAGALTGRHQELEEIGDIARSLASTLDLQLLLPRITEAVERLVDPDGCGIALVTDAGTRLRAADFTLGLLADTAGEEIPMDGTVPGWVTRSGRPLLIGDTTTDGRVGSTYVDPERIRSVICAPLLGRSGVLGALTAVRARSNSRVFDVSDLRLLERLAGSASIAVENARLLEAAEAASRAKSAFIATMSHELRTPLNGVLGNLELLEIGIYGELSKKQSETIGRMQAATQQLRQLIEEVLSFSRLESGRIDVQLVEADICALLGQVAGIIAPLAREKGLDFEADCRLPEGFTQRTDPEKVRQILIYLAGNAVKFTERGQVRMRIRRTDRHLLAIIEDTGVGIDPRDRRRLFQPFEQLNSGLSRAHGGAGLGLYLAGRYAELVGGRIEVQSEPGVGSRFTLVLPLHRVGQSERGRDAGEQTLARVTPPPA